ncbi:hypothetical protein R1T43_11345 [Alteromonas sp. CI.11.F.A3]|uniref:hypothetical protein n=1 Tax=Alteromonas sp. CI.11.F.A3 TaxID=3079555 RepID=UPI002943EDF7|nr:hypothetical protein [Alteromonas sp. CI.11.F.A3]WOI35681.1 hypothetical protein R1T43_10600 [Alteromonas sp. CI.11.F.A3]WOI35822.1 hypothetical protein R1T43_11345 [Alteromonas sp. CI.11.F.A3]
MSSVVMASVAPVVLMDYSSFNEQRLPYSLRRVPVTAQPFSSVYVRGSITVKLLPS